MWPAGAAEARGGVVRPDNPLADRVAALLAWMQGVRVGELVKDQRPPKAAALRAVLDKLANTNRNAVQAIKAAFSASDMSPLQVRNIRTMAGRRRRWHNTAPEGSQ
jgi:hypothetical protein